jgi:hypothetical protein
MIKKDSLILYSLRLQPPDKCFDDVDNVNDDDDDDDDESVN